MKAEDLKQIFYFGERNTKFNTHVSINTLRASLLVRIWAHSLIGSCVTQDKLLNPTEP